MSWVSDNFSKVKIYEKTLWNNYLSKLGIFSSIVTLISFFFTANNFNINTFFWAKIFLLCLIVLFLKMWWNANHLNSVDLRINSTKVHISEGDIWDLFRLPPENRNSQISVIGVNDFYDITVDNRIIAKTSLHGQYINKIIESQKLDALNSTIEHDEFLNKEDNRTIVSNRKVGRKVRYNIGSVVEFESYVLTAFTKFDENNKAYLTAHDYTSFWMTFWENIDEIYAGRTINIPLMGAGITRFKNGKPSKQELLEVMLRTLKISGFHNTYADKQINIVIYPTDAKEIDFHHIKHNFN